ncbi:MAG: hydrogenase nickel incorporation protein HypB [Alphaproteobacteria bacterium]|nr:hydrogenase nickel incorporation protein HypB [Alphaproteobacteria bacterium]
MCLTCGCNHSHDHHHDDGHVHDHDHHHEHSAPLGAVHEHGVDKTRTIKIEEDILAENNRFAAANRAVFAKHKILALNLVSSPGSGKTTLLAATLSAKRFPAAVIEGDQQTDIDAGRIRATGAPAVQINTGRGCHLDAHMAGHAMEDLKLDSGTIDGGVVFIENVGNLVCPAAFDLGEAAKVVLLSVTEGDDKPLKYPDMFRAAKLMILTKSDLLPHVPFDPARCLANARQINPAIEVLTLSATTGEGMHDWFAWMEKMRSH